MFAKILLAALVIVVAIIALRRRKVPNPQPKLKPEPGPQEQLIKGLAYGGVAVMLFIGAVFYYQNWQDDHRLYQVRIVNPQTGQEDIFQVYKKDLKGRNFTTTDGQRVTASELERLELQELL